jgi:hypothetical protein
MLDSLTSEDFEAYLGQPFEIHYGNDEALRVVLTEVQRSPYPPAESAKRSGFSLLFQSSLRDYLPQGIYRLSSPDFTAAHGDMHDELDLFIVPLAPTAEGVRYEVIFN